MWEFSLNLKNKDQATYILSSLKRSIGQIGGVMTSHIDGEQVSLLFAVNETKREEVEKLLSRSITRVICTYYKTLFLDKNLCLPSHDKMGLIAFKKALLNFDRETDYYIVENSLFFDHNLYLESFYEFRLKSLKDKWSELVSLANENRDYLISADAFDDLLKFLVDNLEICEDNVDIIEENDGYKIYSSDTAYQNKILDDEGLISSIIDLSPQKITMYLSCKNSISRFLERLFDQRIVVKTDDALQNFKKS